MILTGIPKEHLPKVKEVVWPYLERGAAVDGGRVTAEGTWKQLEDGDSQLWLVLDEGIRAVVMTSVVEYPDLKACAIELCVGEGRHEWLHLLEQLESWARDHGCEVMEGVMRPGWKLDGYRVRRHMTEKRL